MGVHRMHSSRGSDLEEMHCPFTALCPQCQMQSHSTHGGLVVSTRSCSSSRLCWNGEHSARHSIPQVYTPTRTPKWPERVSISREKGTTNLISTNNQTLYTADSDNADYADNNIPFHSIPLIMQ